MCLSRHFTSEALTVLMDIVIDLVSLSSVGGQEMLGRITKKQLGLKSVVLCAEQTRQTV